MVSITGDTHGYQDRFFLPTGELVPEFRKLTSADILIVAGDFGYVWRSDDKLKLLDRLLDWRNKMFRRKKTKVVEWNEALEFEKSRREKEMELEDLFPSAVEVVFSAETTTRSIIPLLQKKMKLSYGTAARLMDLLEERGLVSEFVPEEGRTRLMNRAEWEKKCAEKAIAAEEAEIPVARPMVERGEVYQLEREYRVEMVVDYQGYEYALFLTTREPYQVKFGKIIPCREEEEFDVEIVSEPEMKYRLRDMFFSKTEKLCEEGKL